MSIIELEMTPAMETAIESRDNIEYGESHGHCHAMFICSL